MPGGFVDRNAAERLCAVQHPEHQRPPVRDLREARRRRGRRDRWSRPRRGRRIRRDRPLAPSDRHARQAERTMGSGTRTRRRSGSSAATCWSATSATERSAHTTCGTGNFRGQLKGTDHRVLKVDGLWGMAFGNGLDNQPSGTLFAAAGPDDENHGTYNAITPAPGKGDDAKTRTATIERRGTDRRGAPFRRPARPGASVANAKRR